MKNKTLAILLAIILQIGLINVNASTQNWDSFGGNITNSKLNYAKLSTKINKTNINEVKTGDVKEPIIVNDKVYVVKTKTENNNSSLLELDLEGNIKHTIPLSGS
ncbi:MAG: hypothetical protein RR425_07045, partial [Erysipelotrichales bacterium]